MYRAEELTVYPFFRRLLEETPLAGVLDSLTGTVSRAWILGFMQSLIDEGAVFTVGMADLDNFKSFNDHYGHTVGDQVLTTVADNLRTYVGSRGLVGRFGGDEFLIISFIGNDYDRVHDFYANMFNQNNVYAQTAVFRRNLDIGPLKLFISATIGSASFPKDAQDFDSLFALVDKTLYRGKFKGRNCYIIYLPEKHAHLEIPRLARHSLYDTFVEMAEGFDRGGSPRERLLQAFAPLKSHMRFQYLFLIDADHRMTDLVKDEVLGVCEDLSPLISEGYFSCSHPTDLAAYPRLQALLSGYGIYSILLLPVGTADRRPGCLLLSPEPGTLHIWQDEEYAAGFLLARLMGEGIKNDQSIY